MNEKIIRISCRYCGSYLNTPVMRGLADIEEGSPGNFDISICNSCYFIYLSTAHDESSVKLAYQNSYHAFSQKNRFLKFLKRLRSVKRYERLKKQIKFSPGISILEVGYGNGDFLFELERRLKKMPCTIIGADIEQNNLYIPLESRIEIIDISDLFLSGLSKFDLVVMYEVLEHMYHPLEFIHNILEILNDGGVIVGSVPNIDSFGYYVFGKNWSGLQVPRHISFFTVNTLKKFFKKSGYENIEIYPVLDPGELAVSIGNLFRNKSSFNKSPRDRWYYMPLIIATLPIQLIRLLIFRSSGTMEFRVTKG